MQRDQQSWSIVLKTSNVFDSCQKRNYLSPLKNIEEEWQPVNIRTEQCKYESKNNLCL